MSVLLVFLVRMRTTDDVWGYIHRHRLPVNPVYAKLRRLGAPEQCLRSPRCSTPTASSTAGSPGYAAAGL